MPWRVREKLNRKVVTAGPFTWANCGNGGKRAQPFTTPVIVSIMWIKRSVMTTLSHERRGAWVQARTVSGSKSSRKTDQRVAFSYWSWWVRRPVLDKLIDSCFSEPFKRHISCLSGWRFIYYVEINEEKSLKTTHFISALTFHMSACHVKVRCSSLLYVPWIY